MKKTVTIFVIIVLIAGACANKEVKIKPMSNVNYQIGNTERQYYTIANYEHTTQDSLCSILNTYLNSIYPYEKIIEEKTLFSADFYKKSLFINYEKRLHNARYESSTFDYSMLYHNLVAEILYLRKEDNDYAVFHTKLYNQTETNEPSIALWKKDTIKINSQ